MEDPKKPYKPKEKYPQKAKGMSFFAFLFSIFVYISAFYIFNLSPSTLFKTSKFWFLISNTLILILAVDYGAFSSSKNKQQEVYDEYLTHSEARRAISPSTSFASECQEIATKGHILHEQPLLQQEADYAEKYMQGYLDKNLTKTPERELLQIVAKEDKKEDHVQEKRIVHVDHKRGFDTNKVIDVQTKAYRRSKSEKAKRVVFDETKNNVILKRSETNYNEQENDHDHHDVEAMNEFATMSDEDLNRRVEEFIQRFNRQIRLQARGDI